MSTTRQLTLGVLAMPEIVLLRVTDLEDIHPHEGQEGDTSRSGRTEVDGVEGEVPRLKTEDEGDPGEVAEREHEAETVGRDVHLVEDGALPGSAGPITTVGDRLREDLAEGRDGGV